MKWKRHERILADLPLVHCNIDRTVGKVLSVDTMLVHQVDIRRQPQQLRIDRSVCCLMAPVELVRNRQLHLLQLQSNEGD